MIFFLCLDLHWLSVTYKIKFMIFGWMPKTSETLFLSSIIASKVTNSVEFESTSKATLTVDSRHGVLFVVPQIPHVLSCFQILEHSDATIQIIVFQLFCSTGSYLFLKMQRLSSQWRLSGTHLSPTPCSRQPAVILCKTVIVFLVQNLDLSITRTFNINSNPHMRWGFTDWT